MQAEASDLKLSQGMGAQDRGPKSLLVYRHKGAVQDFLFLVGCFCFSLNSAHAMGPKYIFIP